MNQNQPTEETLAITKTLNPTPMKRCPQCPDGVLLPATLEYFYPNWSKKDNLSCYCKRCQRAKTSINAKDRRRNARKRHEREHPSTVPEGYKHCTNCQENKPATSEFFSRRSISADGFSFWCKSCVRSYQRDYYRTTSTHNRQQAMDTSTPPELQPAVALPENAPY